MCYFLYIGSPLTLSEVRSMLPAGLTADLASTADQLALKTLLPSAQTVARILAGRCSCDLVRQRLPDPRDDERHLRERYRSLGVSRPDAVAALERHRRAGGLPVPREGWGPALAGFIAEHARNAGPTLYYLQFSADPAPLSALGTLRHVTVPLVTGLPETWLPERSPTLVSR
jgi:hypothetical protein